LLSNLIGVAFPAYASIRAVERPRPDDDERWLTYWSVFGLFSLLDSGASKILSYVHVYFLPKIAILYWLQRGDGALVVYRKALRPALV
ncbi:TB2/DP1/HVA22-related protein, partial [Blyttiomyces helicus]